MRLERGKGDGSGTVKRSFLTPTGYRAFLDVMRACTVLMGELADSGDEDSGSTVFNLTRSKQVEVCLHRGVPVAKLQTLRDESPVDAFTLTLATGEAHYFLSHRQTLTAQLQQEEEALRQYEDSSSEPKIRAHRWRIHGEDERMIEQSKEWGYSRSHVYDEGDAAMDKCEGDDLKLRLWSRKFSRPSLKMVKTHCMVFFIERAIDSDLQANCGMCERGDKPRGPAPHTCNFPVESDILEGYLSAVSLESTAEFIRLLERALGVLGHSALPPNFDQEMDDLIAAGKLALRAQEEVDGKLRCLFEHMMIESNDLAGGLDLFSVV